MSDEADTNLHEAYEQMLEGVAGSPDETEAVEAGSVEPSVEHEAVAPETPSADQVKAVASEAASQEMGELKGQLAALTNLVTQLTSQRAPAAPEPVVAPEIKAPSLVDDPADDFVRFYAREAISPELNEIKASIKALTDAVGPLVQRERFVGAYQQEATAMGADAQSMASRVAQIMGSDEDLADIAAVDPNRAARIALKMARSQVKDASVSPPAPSAQRASPRQPRPAARPNPASSPRRVAETTPGSWQEAVSQSLQEQGISPGAHYEFTTIGGADGTAH